MGTKRILLVDDEVTVTRTLKLYLEGTGKYEVWTENQGKRAVAAAREFKPDLIVLDLVMPDMEGSMVAAALREESETKEIPILFLTALVRQEEVGPTGRIGGYPFAAKPVDPDRLVERIEEQLAGA